MKLLLIIFIVLGAIHIIFVILGKETLRRITKVLLMPVLLAAYLAAGAQNYLFLPVLALIFGWIGDVLLLKVDMNKPLNFQLGLASFLLGHVCYLIAFIQILGWNVSGGPVAAINIPAIIVFTPQATVLGIVVFRLIKPSKEMYGPVIFYMLMLVAMGIFGFQVFLVNPGLAGLLIVSGCFSFMISDTILAYYTFRKLKVSGTVLLMLFYILAQGKIIAGLLSLQPGVLF